MTADNFAIAGALLGLATLVVALLALAVGAIDRWLDDLFPPAEDYRRTLQRANREVRTYTRPTFNPKEN